MSSTVIARRLLGVSSRLEVGGRLFVVEGGGGCSDKAEDSSSSTVEVVASVLAYKAVLTLVLKAITSSNSCASLVASASGVSLKRRALAYLSK